MTLTWTYWAALLDYTLWGLGFDEATRFSSADDASKATRIHVFSLALTLRLWARPHYRHGTFQDDALANLRNVAVPGTGVPLSVFCLSV